MIAEPNGMVTDQISTELADLIGADFDPAFVTWLFAEVATHYSDTPAESSTIVASALDETSASAAVVNDGRSTNDRRASGRGNGVFGQAMSGMKRDARGLTDGRDQVPNVRARYEQRSSSSFEGIPAGPKNPVQPGRNDRNERRNGGGRGGSIFDRVQPAINPSFGAAPPGYDTVRFSFFQSNDDRSLILAIIIDSINDRRGYCQRRPSFSSRINSLQRSTISSSGGVPESSGSRSSSGSCNGTSSGIRCHARPANRLESRL
jgi:hypothetical protein